MEATHLNTHLVFTRSGLSVVSLSTRAPGYYPATAQEVECVIVPGICRDEHEVRVAYRAAFGVACPL